MAKHIGSLDTKRERLTEHRSAIVILLGPTVVGKGFITKHLRERYRSQGFYTIGIGDMCRERDKNDLVFHRKHGPVMEDGGLVPDSEIFPMAENEYLKALKECTPRILNDGLYRLDSQVHWGIGKGFIDPSTTVVIDLVASKETLDRRLAHRIERMGKTPRNDSHKHDERVRIHTENNPAVLQAFGINGFKIFRVDADHELEHVAQAIDKGLRPFWGDPDTDLHPAFSPHAITDFPLELCPRKRVALAKGLPIERFAFAA